MPHQAPLDPAAAVALPIHHDPQFRRLWAMGMLISLIRSMEMLAFAVFAYTVTQSAMWVASMMMLRMLPLALFGLVLGAVAARIPRCSGLLVSYGALLLTTVSLLVIASLGAIEVWHLAAASFINGAVWAGDMPMRRGLMGDIAGLSRMAHAMSLDAVASNACRLLGPAIGGLLLAGGGLTAVFLLAAILYLPALAAVIGLSERPAAQPPMRTGLGTVLARGFQAARESARFRATLWLTILFNLFAWPVLSMVPVIGQSRLHLDTQGIGLLASMDAVGSLVGAILLTSLSGRLRHAQVYVGALLCFLALQIVFAWSAHPVLTGATLLLLGLVQAGFAVMQTTLVYTAVPQGQRMEAMGLLTMCIGVSPLGFLAIGWLAERMGAPMAAMTCALGGFASLLLTWPVWRPCLRDASR
ncbi:MAG: MFS transporter [Rhodoferax sp.]|nr:MFS transporter [Rhodoferax sp.]